MDNNKEDFTVWYARQISNLIHETTQEEKEKTMKNNLSFIAIFAVVFSAFAMLFCGGTSIMQFANGDVGHGIFNLILAMVNAACLAFNIKNIME